MNKLVSRINWVNDTDPAINDTHLNQMDSELDALDDRVIGLEGACEAQAENAEAWAVGERGGEAVTSGDETYQNNSKYYANQAANSATNAGTSETNAGNSATAASNSSTAASNSALVSEGYAKGTQNGSPVSSGSPYYENNAEYFKNRASQIVGSKVDTFNGRTGAVVPMKGDYDADKIEFDPSTTSLPNALDTLQDFLEYAYPPGVTVTLTLNGAKEDQITIKDANNQTVATCNFASGQTSGSVQLTVPVGGGTYKFVSSVAKDTTTGMSDYEKTVTLTDTVSQTVNVYPKNALYWFGNEITPITVSATSTGSATKNTNNIDLKNNALGDSAYAVSALTDLTGFTNVKCIRKCITPSSTMAGGVFGYSETDVADATYVHVFVNGNATTGDYSEPSLPGVADTVYVSSISVLHNASMYIKYGQSYYTGEFQLMALWLDDGHEDDITIHGAKEDTITITDSQNQTVATCVFGSSKTYGYVSKALLPSGTYKFTSSVAKDTTTGTSDYEKTITLDGSENEVNVMPDGALYWYGNFVNGTTYEIGTPVVRNPVSADIIINTNSVTFSHSPNFRGILSNTTLGNGTLKMLGSFTSDTTPSSSGIGCITDDTQMTDTIYAVDVQGTQTEHIYSGSSVNGRYAFTFAYNGSGVVKAFWIE